MTERICQNVEFVVIGHVESRFEQQAGTPIQGRLAPEEVAKVIIYEDFVSGIKDLEGFSHIYVFFKFDRASTRKLLVKPYLDTEERGVFSTRSPLRPNPLGMTIVRLEKVEGNTLFISGVDILNSSPVIDIKPYIPDFDHNVVDRIGWYEKNSERNRLVLADDRFDNRD